jgi:hypothetical protein
MLAENPEAYRYDYAATMDTPILYIYTNDPFALSKDLPANRVSSAAGKDPYLMYNDLFDTTVSDEKQMQFVDDINTDVYKLGYGFTIANSKAAYIE